jgi:hypothetical protein
MHSRDEQILAEIEAIATFSLEGEVQVCQPSVAL